MNPCGSALPELHGFGNDAEAAPEGRKGDFTVLEFFADFAKFLHEQLARADDRTLLRDPSAELGVAWAGGEIAQRLGGRDFFRTTLDDDLAFHGDPRKEQADVRVLCDLLGLATFVIGEKDEALVIKIL